MSSADYDVAYCDACERCHLNGICPLTDKAQKEASMTDAGWAEKKADSQTCPQCAEQYGMGDNGDIVHVPSVVRLLHKEHARSVRIVKAEIKRVMLDQHEYTDRKKELLLESLNGVLTALQRGRGKGGVK